MMKARLKLGLILLLVGCLLCVGLSTVSANDNSTNTGDFTELNNLVQNNNVIDFDKDYNATDKTFYKGITISNGMNVTINGNGHTIDGNYQGRIFDIKTGGTLTLNNVKIINGKVSGNGASYGGAIYINKDATLNINNCVFNNNLATGKGNAIYNTGTLIINNTLFDNENARDTDAIVTNNGLTTYKINYYTDGFTSESMTEPDENNNFCIYLYQPHKVQIHGGIELSDYVLDSSSYGVEVTKVYNPYSYIIHIVDPTNFFVKINYYWKYGYTWDNLATFLEYSIIVGSLDMTSVNENDVLGVNVVKTTTTSSDVVVKNTAASSVAENNTSFGGAIEDNGTVNFNSSEEIQFYNNESKEESPVIRLTTLRFVTTNMNLLSVVTANMNTVSDNVTFNDEPVIITTGEAHKKGIAKNRTSALVEEPVITTTTASPILKKETNGTSEEELDELREFYEKMNEHTKYIKELTDNLSSSAEDNANDISVSPMTTTLREALDIIMTTSTTENNTNNSDVVDNADGNGGAITSESTSGNGGAIYNDNSYWNHIPYEWLHEHGYV